MSGSFRIAPVVPGVYLLFKDRELTYVGKSTDCYGRIEGHRSKGRDFDYAVVAGCGEHDTGWIEQALIRAFAPRQNRQRHVRPAEPQTVVVQAAPPERGIPSDPDKLLTLIKASALAKEYGLVSRFNRAVESGALPFVYLTEVRGKGAAKRIFAGELRRWVDSEVAAIKAA